MSRQFIVGGSREPRRVLVTGGAGFVGSQLVDHLLTAGLRVTVLDCSEPSPSHLVPDTIMASMRSSIPESMMARDSIRDGLSMEWPAGCATSALTAALVHKLRDKTVRDRTSSYRFYLDYDLIVKVSRSAIDTFADEQFVRALIPPGLWVMAHPSPIGSIGERDTCSRWSATQRIFYGELTRNASYRAKYDLHTALLSSFHNVKPRSKEMSRQVGGYGGSVATSGGAAFDDPGVVGKCDPWPSPDIGHERWNCETSKHPRLRTFVEGLKTVLVRLRCGGRQPIASNLREIRRLDEDGVHSLSARHLDRQRESADLLNVSLTKTRRQQKWEAVNAWLSECSTRVQRYQCRRAEGGPSRPEDLLAQLADCHERGVFTSQRYRSAAPALRTEHIIDVLAAFMRADRVVPLFGTSESLADSSGAVPKYEATVIAVLRAHDVDFEIQPLDALPACVVSSPFGATVFVDESLSSEARATIALHEFGHLQLGHRPSSAWGCDYRSASDEERALHNEQEREADDFARLWKELFLRVMTVLGRDTSPSSNAADIRPEEAARNRDSVEA